MELAEQPLEDGCKSLMVFNEPNLNEKNTPTVHLQNRYGKIDQNL